MIFSLNVNFFFYKLQGLKHDVEQMICTKSQKLVSYSMQLSYVHTLKFKFVTVSAECTYSLSTQIGYELLIVPKNCLDKTVFTYREKYLLCNCKVHTEF